ncbi:MAG: RNA polymerase sigma factor [Hyphomicrobiales bacterium]|nr:RNA polymerase sigma factor [Hyphomicrobiales bacterium]
MTDLELAERTREGDRNAFRQLLERHYDTAYRVALRFTGSAPDAEDIAQDVCLALVDKLRSFRGQSRFSTWFYRVVVNACRDHHRKQKTAAALQASYAVFRELDQADQIDDAKRLGWLGEAIAGLQPTLRETAILVLAEDLTHRQAAAALGCAERTVSWRMHEVRKQLRMRVDTLHDR